MADVILNAELTAKTDNLVAGLKTAETATHNFSIKSKADLEAWDRAVAESSYNNQRLRKGDMIVSEQFAERAAAAAKAARLAAAETQAAGSGFTSFAQGAGKAFSAVRQLAYILPGVGIAGILAFATEPIMNYISSLDLFKRSLSESQQLLLNLKLTGDKYAETLGAIGEATLKGDQNATKELVTLKLLYDRTQNLTLSQKDRIKATEDLKRLHPDTFKGLSDEAIMAGQAADKYKLLAGSILQVAEAEAKFGLLVEKQKQRVELSQKEADLQPLLLKSLREKTALEKLAANATRATGQSGEVIALGAINRAAEADKKYNELLGERTSIQLKIDKLDKDSAELSKTAEPQKAKGVDDTNKKLSEQIPLVEDLNALFAEGAMILQQTQAKEFLKNFKVPSGAEARNIYGQKTVNIGASALGEKFQHLPSVGLPVPGKPLPLPDIEEALTPLQSILSDTIPQLNSAFDSFFNNILEKGKFSFGALGQAIIKSFESVLVSQATKSLFNLIANAGNGKAGGGGGTGNGLGPLAIAGLVVGGVSLVASLFKKHHSDPLPVPSYAAASSSGGSFTNGGVVEFRIAGTTLIGVLNNAGQSLSRYRNGV